MKTRNGRIAIFLPNLAGGGAERLQIIFAQYFLDAGYDVDFVLWQATGDLMPLVPPQCRVIDLNSRRLRAGIRPAAAYIRESAPDAILASLWPLTAYAVLARFLSRRRPVVVVADHAVISIQYGSRNWLFRQFLWSSIALAYRLADASVAVSWGSADDLATLSGVPRDRFTVIHNPLPEHPRPTPEELAAAERLWGERTGPRILGVGSLKPPKNFPLLIDAFARVDAPAGAKLMILGEGQLRESLEDQARRLGLADRVLFPGFFGNPAPFYRTADLFVLSSDHEGFGLVILEAMANGLPVVCTDCPSGPAEILEGGKYGRLVPVRDPAALAEAIRQTLTEPRDTQSTMRRAAEFTVERAAEAYLDLLFPGRATIAPVGDRVESGPSVVG